MGNKPKSLRSFTKTVQKEFNKLIASKGFCEKCGRRYDRLECSHVKSIGAYPNLRFDILNVLCMCSRCHIWWWHDEPTESGAWFKKKFPARYDYLLEAKNVKRKWTIDDLYEIREAVKKKDFTKLILSPEELDIMV